jgi:exonuclease III
VKIPEYESPYCDTTLRSNFSELMRKAQIVDVYRNFYPDEEECATFFTQKQTKNREIVDLTKPEQKEEANDSSGNAMARSAYRTSYILVSEKLLKSVKGIKICNDRNRGISHSPILVTLCF